MKRMFVHTEGFETQLDALKTPTDFLIDVEQEILKDLQRKVSARDVISGTGGLTKLRVAFKSQNKGKSGSARVMYLDLPDSKIVFLLMIYSKSSMENISAEGKKALKRHVQGLKSWKEKKGRVRKK